MAKKKASNATDNREGLSNENFFEVIEGEDMFESGAFLNVTDTEKTQSNNENEFRQFFDYMESGKILKVTVTRADDKGNLYVPIAKNIIGFIENKDVTGTPYDAKKRSKYVNISFGVVVTQVDPVNRRVHFSRIGAIEKYRQLLKSNLVPGTKVKARVNFVSEKTKRVFVDIEGCGIFGYIPINEWDYGYIYDPIQQIKKNTVVSAEIMGYREKTDNLKAMYICSRKNTLPNPWIGIEERFPKNTILIGGVKDLRPDKFFATVPGLDLDLFCEYPDNTGKEEDEKIIIKLGRTYKFRIYNVSEKRMILRARVVSEVTE